MMTQHALVCALALAAACGDTVIQVLPPAETAEVDAGDGDEAAAIDAFPGEDGDDAEVDDYVPPGMPAAGDCLLMVTRGGEEGPRLVRAATFQRTPSGELKTPSELRLYGYAVNELGMDFVPTVLSLPLGIQPLATSRITLSVNFDASARVPDPFDVANPAGTSNFSSGATVYDASGAAQAVTVYYRKSDVDAWEWHALSAVRGTWSDDEYVEGASGHLAFTSGGLLQRQSSDTFDGWVFPSGRVQRVEFDFGNTTSDGSGGYVATTQYGDASSTNGVTNDGHPYLPFASYEVTPEGMLNGVTGDGVRYLLAWLALAQLESNAGMRRAPDGSFLPPDEGPTWRSGTGGQNAVTPMLPCSVEVESWVGASAFSMALTAQ